MLCFVSLAHREAACHLAAICLLLAGVFRRTALRAQPSWKPNDSHNTPQFHGKTRGLSLDFL